MEHNYTRGSYSRGAALREMSGCSTIGMPSSMFAAPPGRPDRQPGRDTGHRYAPRSATGEMIVIAPRFLGV